MIINCIAIDDEPLAIDKISSFIEKIDYLSLKKTFDNAFEAINFLKNNKIDLMFLDIQMDEFTGIQMLETILNPPKVILTTAYDSYALKGYELNITDYLLKPFPFARFLTAVEKVYNLMEANFQTKNNRQINIVKNDQPKTYMFVKDGYKVVKVDFDDILYIKGMKDYLTIITLSNKIHTLQNFQNMEIQLPNNKFIRVHKSYIVAINKISRIEKNRINISDEFIPIGDYYKKSFYDKLAL